MKEDVRRKYRDWIDSAEIKTSERGRVDRALLRALQNRSAYERAESEHGVPWQLLAAINELESGGRMDRHIANGDPLTARTTHVPEGLPRAGDPPFTWSEVLTEELAEKITGGAQIVGRLTVSV